MCTGCKGVKINIMKGKANITLQTLAVFEQKTESTYIQVILVKIDNHYKVSKFVDNERISCDVFNHYTEASRFMVELIEESM